MGRVMTAAPEREKIIMPFPFPWVVEGVAMLSSQAWDTLPVDRQHFCTPVIFPPAVPEIPS
eukprot:10573262-Karenia_brevis.AAC.1